MKIKMPERYSYVFQLLMDAGISSDTEESMRLLVQSGIEEAESDLLLLQGTPNPHPDIHPEALEGPFAEFELKDKSALQGKLMKIAQGFAVTESSASSICLIYGCGSYYPILKDSEKYKTDEQFQKKVKGLPHEIDWDMSLKELRSGNIEEEE